jgi:hypothetical protein
MNRFLKIFLRDRLNHSVQLAGFGKHPAWNDHIDDVGLTTETLVIVKRILYSDGIASQVSSGAWNRLEESGRALEFDHRFVWSRETQSVVGGIWASIDGKGRDYFPIIICLQIPLNGWRAVRNFLASVEQLGGACRATNEQQKFRHLFEETQVKLRSDLFSNSDPENKLYDLLQEREEAILNGMIALSQGVKNYQRQGARDGDGSAHFRVPAISPRPKESLEFWAGYLETWLDLRLPCLTLASAGLGPVDIIAGEPVGGDLFCLRASEDGLSMTLPPETDRRTADVRLAAKVYLRSFAQGVIEPVKGRLTRHWWPFK